MSHLEMRKQGISFLNHEQGSVFLVDFFLKFGIAFDVYIWKLNSRHFSVNIYLCESLSGFFNGLTQYHKTFVVLSFFQLQQQYKYKKYHAYSPETKT